MNRRPVAAVFRRHTAAFAAFSAALLIVGQLLTVAHESLVRHTVCAEHGELIHASPHQTPAALSTLDGHAALRAVDGTAGHGHEHCSVLARTRDQQGVCRSACLGFIEPPGTSHVPTAIASAPAHGTVEILLIAPKQSPPA